MNQTKSEKYDYVPNYVEKKIFIELKIQDCI